MMRNGGSKGEMSDGIYILCSPLLCFITHSLDSIVLFT